MTAGLQPLKPNALAPDSVEQARVMKGVGIFEIVGPERKRLDHHAGFQHHIECDAGHIERRGGAVAMRAIQHDGDIGIAVGTVIAARAAAKQDRFANRVALRQMPQECLRRAGGRGIDRRALRRTGMK
jgi:hypothetical protein